jgi:hypothetical protein
MNCESFYCGPHYLARVWLSWKAGALAWRQAPWLSVCRALGLGANQGARRVATWCLVCPALGAGTDQERTRRLLPYPQADRPSAAWHLLSFLLGALRAPRGAWAAYTFSIIARKIYIF